MLKKQAEPLLYAAFQPAVTSFGDNNFLVITTMSLTLKQRGKSILHSGSCLSYNEGVIGLTEHCLPAQ
jgi:hypothetical protein